MVAELSKPTIEQDIAELEKQLEAKKSALEHEKSAAGGEPRQGQEKDILHGLVGEKIQESRLEKSRIPDSQGESGHVSFDLRTSEPPSYLSQELKDKIQSMVQTVFAKNLDEGIKEAVKTENIAVIDAFHDILVDKLYDQLIEKRKLDKVE